jgi:membrane protease YdiL (CAAX protease family)
MVLAPIAMAVVAMVIGVSAMAAWQIVHGMAVKLPTPANVRLYGLLSYAVAIFVFLFVVTTPVSEEILYRGLLVAWLRRVGWSDSAILLVGSLIFGANHFIPLGFVWSAAMVALGAILYALRLRYDSLAPAWLAHVLFNAQPILLYPLIAWLAPAVLPGRL